MTAPASRRFVTQHTLCELDLTHPAVIRAVLDPQDMHRLIMSAYRHWIPESVPDARAQMNVLHTHVVNLRDQTLTVIIQSAIPGDVTAWPSSVHLTPPQTRTVDVTVTTGQRLRFRTVVNPARQAAARLAGPRPRRSQDAADARPDRALQWFTARLRPPTSPDDHRFPYLGAEVDTHSLQARILPTLIAHATHQGMRVNRAEIQGQLTVTDPRAFTRTLTQGLGRSRAYGCGLLLTQPLPSHAPA
ncbi:type I-E CRISPR-associated protein Cas6/Cse3/CasE [Streptomyces noboritoensis]|uniref:Type I-E CRISPR-associated protein Cas6/Cse3/CasE n=1 Tax=Streptomyces noboritoensis TaxID=67337 RepID=A0ABV6TEH0_9ACTN